ncbi:sigma factor-like helix-turn-helix DNA-binding protein [Bacillus sp. JNUCC-21]|uniref:sigma factor-like helix-turn-helix DNA-binding protein n=1 Tax=Bacillus sp. JNUCC-21 TaxID=3240102 RepID=UPI0035111EE2
MSDQMMAWEIEEWIRDYNFMLREISRLSRILNKVEFAGQKLVATYGDEAGMPRGSAGKSQAELRQMDRREKRLRKYEIIVDFLERSTEEIEDEKSRIVFDCMLEGMRFREIALHLGVSRETVRRIKNDIVCHLCQMCETCQLLQLLNQIKSAV